MAQHRKKPHGDSLESMKGQISNWQQWIHEQGDKAQEDDIENHQKFEEAVHDYEKNIDTESANDKRDIARSLGSVFQESNAYRGLRVRSGGGELGKKTEKILSFARSLLPAGGPPYQRGIPANIIRQVSKKYECTVGSTKALLYRHKVFEYR